MLLLSIFLLSSCLPGSTGSATEEFQENFKALVDLASEKIFLPVPVGKFQCSCVPCHLKGTLRQLKYYFQKDQMRRYVSLMEGNAHHIISTLNKAHTRPEEDDSCRMTEVHPRDALKRYRRFFQKLREMC